MALVTGGSQDFTDNGFENTNIRAMSIATVLFFMWGFLTCLNDILIPHLKSIFDLNYAEAMLVQFAFFSSYFVFALPSGKIIEWVGYKRGMIIGLLTMTTGALLFLPAATNASYGLFLGALIVLAAGITLLQVAANPYVAMLGPERTASSRLNLSQAFNSFGTFVAPFFGSAVILANLPKEQAGLTGAALQAARVEQAASVRMPYLGIALMLAALAIALALVKLPTLSFTKELRPADLPADLQGKPHDSIFKHSQLVLGAVGIFVYVGAEVAIGSFLINYFELPYIGNLTAQKAALYVSLYWGGAMVGRFIGSAILRRVSTGKVLGVAAAMACLLVIASMLSLGNVAMWTIIAVGLFNSIMFPSIFTLGIEGLGPLTSRGSSLLVAAIVGGALIPLAEGKLADKIGVHHAFIIPAVCYVYIAIFGLTRRGTSAKVPKAELADVGA
jgi:MFS transporter, FHS family, L-fucose permease